MEDFLQWEKNVLNSIADLADIEEQKQAWSGKQSNLASSFSELMSALYDDFDFERYIITYKERTGVDLFYESLIQLDQKIKAFEKDAYELDATNDGYKMILKDLRWIEISAIAHKIAFSLK